MTISYRSNPRLLVAVAGTTAGIDYNRRQLSILGLGIQITCSLVVRKGTCLCASMEVRMRSRVMPVEREREQRGIITDMRYGK